MTQTSFCLASNKCSYLVVSFLQSVDEGDVRRKFRPLWTVDSGLNTSITVRKVFCTGSIPEGLPGLGSRL